MQKREVVEHKDDDDDVPAANVDMLLKALVEAAG